jgi:hypothetical protein
MKGLFWTVVLMIVLAVIIGSMSGGPSQTSSTTTTAKAAAPEVSRETYQLQGCKKYNDLTGVYEQATMASCQKTIGAMKDDMKTCMLGGAMIRSAALNEHPSRRPPGVILDIQVACGMMLDGMSESASRRLTEKACDTVDTYESQAWCRRERGR